MLTAHFTMKTIHRCAEANNEIREKRKITVTHDTVSDTKKLV